MSCSLRITGGTISCPKIRNVNLSHYRLYSANSIKLSKLAFWPTSDESIKLVWGTMESSIEIPQKFRNGSAFGPRNPTLESSFTSKGTQNTNLK